MYIHIYIYIYIYIIFTYSFIYFIILLRPPGIPDWRESLPALGGHDLSNTTCSTHAFFKRGDQCSKLKHKQQMRLY